METKPGALASAKGCTSSSPGAQTRARGKRQWPKCRRVVCEGNENFLCASRAPVTWPQSSGRPPKGADSTLRTLGTSRMTKRERSLIGRRALQTTTHPARANGPGQWWKAAGPATRVHRRSGRPRLVRCCRGDVQPRYGHGARIRTSCRPSEGCTGQFGMAGSPVATLDQVRSATCCIVASKWRHSPGHRP
jgi:hypothetical protein